MSINHKHLLTLLQDNFTTIRVVFPADGEGLPVQQAQNAATPWSTQPGLSAPLPPGVMPGRQRPQKAYTYKVHKDDNVKLNDTVVVESPNHGLALAHVVDVHAEPDIDLNADFSYKWIVSKVDTTRYIDTLEKEKKFSALVVEAERAKQRLELVQQFKDNLPQDGEARRLFDEAMGIFKSPALNNDTPAK